MRSTTRRIAAKEQSMSRKRVAQEISDGLQPIRDLFALLLEADSEDAFEEAALLVNRAAQRWAALLVPDDEIGETLDSSAVSVAHTLYQLLSVSSALGKFLNGETVRAVEQAPFWATNLGQLIFANNGFPRRPATLQEAAAVLRLTRQAVSKRIATKDLEVPALPKRGAEVRAQATEEQQERLRRGEHIITRSSLYAEWKFRRKVRNWEARSGQKWRGRPIV